MVLSCDEGCLKPESRIFQVAAARVASEPSECVFVDDTAAYVAGARQAGMAGVLIDRPEPWKQGKRHGECDLRVESLQKLLDWLRERAGT